MRHFIRSLVLICVMGVLITIIQPTRAQVRAAASDVGRFQTVRASKPDTIIWMVDSTTSDTWERAVNGNWQYKGKPSNASGNVGEYQLIAADQESVWLVDTSSGDTWYRAPNADWQSKGNPSKDAPPKK